MEPIEALRALAGGVLIGTSASVLLLCNGRIAGISGIAAGLLPPLSTETSWRLAFVLGLLAGGVVLLFDWPPAFPVEQSASLPRIAIAGLLVGIGTRLGNGCTSGHGVCGLARRSQRSLAATITLMATGVATVYVTHHVLAWGL